MLTKLKNAWGTPLELKIQHLSRFTQAPAATDTHFPKSRPSPASKGDLLSGVLLPAFILIMTARDALGYL